MGIDKHYRILAVDDAKDTLMLLEFDLAEEGYQVITSASGENAIPLVGSENIDLILLDMYMPGISGLEVLKRLKSHPEYKHIPIIMLSASDDENQVVSALELGADDYVIKPYMAKVLLARIKTSLRLLEKTQELKRLAKTDFLTKLNNKGGFEKLSVKAISQANRESQPIIMAMLDIDLFKHVNDCYGHEAGDVVLVEFADRMSECFRDYDIIGRVGGEEFAICMPNISLENAYSACERFRCMIENQSIIIHQNNGEPYPLFVTVSIGISEGCLGQVELDNLLREADTNLYKAKNNGRNMVEMCDLPNFLRCRNKTVEQENNILNIENNLQESTHFPGIDLEIGVANVLGDKDLFKDIAEMFYEDHGNDDKKIQQAINELDQAACKHLVHTLKGVSSSIGAMTLFEYVKALDVAINEDNTEQYKVLFEPVATELQVVVNGIKKELSDRL